MAKTASSKKTTYAFLGPVGTFTELALAQVKEAKGAKHLAVSASIHGQVEFASARVDPAHRPFVENQFLLQENPK